MKLSQKNREFVQFFLAVVLKKTAVTTAQLLQFVAHSSITCDPVYIAFQKIKIKQTPGCRIRETEGWGEFNISWQLYTVFYREILIFCAALWLEYSSICSHYVLRSTPFYAMLSLEISKCLRHWRWGRGQSFTLKAFQNLNGVVFVTKYAKDLDRNSGESVVVKKLLGSSLHLSMHSLKKLVYCMISNTVM